MKIITHDKVYQDPSEVIIGNLPSLKNTKIQIELDIVNNPIDSIIYTLICAEAKNDSDSLTERICALPRYERAFTQLKEFIKEKRTNENF